MIDLTKAIEAARELAKEFPDFNYQEEYRTPSRERARCEYVDENTLQGKCFWGRVFVDKLEVDPNVFISWGINGDGVYDVLRHMEFNGTDRQIEWMGAVQDAQDSGEVWKEAIHQADKYFPL